MSIHRVKSWTVAGATTALLLGVASRYGWHRDELYFLEAGHHLAWGYVDQPPFTPLVARVADEVASGNLVVLRLLPALATALTVLLGGALARELGATTRVQPVAAAAVASSGFVLGVGHLLSTAVFDLTCWMAVLWLAARMLRRGDPRLWLPIGTVTGLAMLNKNLVVLLVAAFVAALSIERRFDLLATRWALVGGAVATAIAAPHLAWQASHGFPQADMASALSDRLGAENRATLVPAQLLFVGPALVVFTVRGVGWLARGAGGRTFRPLLWAWVLALAVTFVTGGRPYYVLAATLAVTVAGLVHSLRDRGTSRAVALVALNAVVSVPLALPVLPVGTADIVGDLNEAVAETVGWPELVDQVAAVVETLPPEERLTVVLLAASYGEAGAIDRFGPDHGLPPAYSPHNGYADFRRPSDDGAVVVAVRFPVSRLAPHFERCDHVASVRNDADVHNEARGAPILVCRGLRHGWEATWERLRFLS